MGDPTTLKGWREAALALRDECEDLKFDLERSQRDAEKFKKERDESRKEYDKIEHLDQPHVHAALETLAKVQWAGPGGTCPLCKQHKSGMHTVGCLLDGVE